MCTSAPSPRTALTVTAPPPLRWNTRSGSPGPPDFRVAARVATGRKGAVLPPSLVFSPHRISSMSTSLGGRPSFFGAATCVAGSAADSGTVGKAEIAGIALAGLSSGALAGLSSGASGGRSVEGLR